MSLLRQIIFYNIDRNKLIIDYMANLQEQHLLIHEVLQPHLISSLHALNVSGRLVQYGLNARSLSSHFQPQISGDGTVGLAIRVCLSPYKSCHIYGSFHFCSRAFLVGNMFSMLRF